MFDKIGTDTINKLLLVLVVFLAAEIIFFDGGNLFSLLISGLLVYFGHRSYERTSGKVMFWIGLVSLIMTILSMAIVRFLLFLFLVLFLYNYFQSGKRTDSPSFPESPPQPPEEPVLSSKVWGDESTPQAYAWNDINIHGGVGDKTIDLSRTVLPDKALISIRHLVGNITIYVPYDTEIAVDHSSVIGRATIFDYGKKELWNQNIHYQTEHYGAESPSVRIVTSVFSGDVEVKRI
ncbi:cell wall-active antibiotics response protein LiaF [Salimicrobium halophilum]|uniref:Lia operon protein LiaF n=1 Tax=Salimicrobium halophilum TaxID=86666 RepID=A0A1G8SUU8_9BACI|nr:cell wall-active antibiotics response protein LiaF [Salimicrobium halophilum]SDJ33042.1 lia operon protein LiaF [Salimicrobium halophilum]